MLTILSALATELASPVAFGRVDWDNDMGDVVVVGEHILALERSGTPRRVLKYSPKSSIGSPVELMGLQRPEGFHWTLSNRDGVWMVTKAGVVTLQRLEDERLGPPIEIPGTVPVTSTSNQLTARDGELLVDTSRSLIVVSLTLEGVTTRSTRETPHTTGEGRRPFYLDGQVFARRSNMSPREWVLEVVEWPNSKSPRWRTVPIDGVLTHDLLTVGTPDRGFDPKRPDRPRSEGACQYTLGICRTDEVRFVVPWQGKVLAVNRSGEVFAYAVVP